MANITFDFKLMSSRLLTAALVLPLVMFHTQRAIADKSNLIIANDSSKMITELYLSKNKLPFAEHNILKPDVLPQGSTLEITIDQASTHQCFYNIRAVFADGEVLEDYPINICKNQAYTFLD